MAREFTYEEATAPQSVLGLADQVGVPITNTTIARDVMSFPVDVVAKISRSGEQCGCSCEGWSESEHESDTCWPMCACTACGCMYQACLVLDFNTLCRIAVSIYRSECRDASRSSHAPPI